MQLKVLLPTRVLVDCEVNKVIAEAEDGSFCLLPRHVDFVTALVPGLLTYVDDGGAEGCLAVDGGILVKSGGMVRVSTRDGVVGEQLEQLRALVEERFARQEELERRARGALARLEASALRRFMQVEEPR